MELDISSVSSNAFQVEIMRQKRSDSSKALREQVTAAHEQAKVAAEKSFEAVQKQPSQKDMERYLKDILRISTIFDRKLKFILNRDLNTVVVKVVDKQTDKVIKEIPPEALQRLHKRMKEAIGLLVDEEI